MYEQPQSIYRPFRWVFLYCLLAVIAGLLLTIVLFLGARKAEQGNFRLQFERDAVIRSNLIVQKMEECLIVMKALDRFFAASEHVDRKQFAVFAVGFLTQRRELQALEWVPRVSSAQRAHYEEMGRRQDMPNFEINERDPNGNAIPAKERETYYPVYYVQPLKGNEKAAGFDLGSDAVRRAALERARDTGEPTVTGRIRLVQETEEQFGFLIFVPVYRRGMPTGTIDERRAALEGFALGVFRAGNVLRALLEDNEPFGLPFDLLDLSASEEQRLLHRWPGRLETKDSWKSRLFPVAPRYFERFAFAGREWGVEITASPTYMERHCHFTYGLILPAGFLLTLILAFCIRAILVQRVRLERTVLERTEKLKASEERLHLVLWGADLGTFDWDAEAGTVTRNERWAEILGYSPGEIVSDLRSWQKLVHPEDLPTVMDAWNAHMEGRTPHYEAVYRLFSKSGEWIWVLGRGKVTHRDERGRPRRLAGTILDINQRKQVEEALRESEEKYRLLVENAGEAILIFQNGQVKFTNRETEKLLGCSVRGLTSRLLMKSIHPEDRKMVLGHYLKRERGATVLPLYPFRIVAQNGTIKWVELHSVVIPWKGNSASLSFLRDITERRLGERRLMQAQKAESLGRMAGAIAHNFNNLLGVVMGNLELATLHLHQTAEVQANISEARKASMRAAELSRSMLAYLGRSISARAAIDLAEVCGESLPLLTAVLPSKVRLNTDFPAEGIIVRADALHIREILTNLTVNAGEAIGDREGVVALALKVMPAAEVRTLPVHPSEWEPEDSSYACLSVSDTGDGMDTETLEQVFDPFFSTKFVGRGLGLAVVLGIVKACGGAITVESSPGRGTAFRVLLTLSTEAPPPGREAESADSGGKIRLG